MLDGDFHIRSRSLIGQSLSLRPTVIGYRYLKIELITFQKKDSKTGSLFCDFKDNSSTFNGNVINIPKIGQIPVLMNPNTKSNRDTGRESSWMHRVISTK